MSGKLDEDAARDLAVAWLRAIRKLDIWPVIAAGGIGLVGGPAFATKLVRAVAEGEWVAAGVAAVITRLVFAAIFATVAFIACVRR